MKKKFLLLLAILLFPLVANCQRQARESLEGWLDSSIYQRAKWLFGKKPTYYFNFDGKSVIAYDDIISSLGLKTALVWRKTLRTGIGFSTIYNTPSNLLNASAYWDSLTYGNRRIHYGFLFVEPFIVRTKEWEFYLPVSFAYGRGLFRQSLDASQPKFQWQNTTFLDFTASGNYRIWRWLGAGATIGYKIAITPTDPLYRDQLRGLIFGIRPKIYVLDLYDDVNLWLTKRKNAKRRERERER